MREVELIEAKPLSAAVRALTFAVCDGGPLEYVAGQWVNVDVDIDGRRERRAYSIACAPSEADGRRFEIAVTLVEEGDVSRALHALPLGARLSIDGPHGFFTREDHADKHALLVGTGTGLAPLRAMIQAALRVPSGPRLALLFGSRGEGDILYREELEALAQRHERFRYDVTLSRATPAWSGRRGYVQDHLRELIDTQDRPHVYVCGLTRMVSEVRRVLKDELGYDRKLVHSERYD